MANPKQNLNIAEYLDVLSMQSFLMNNVDKPTWDKNNFLSTLRVFLWYSPEESLRFTDISEACTAVMPIIGGAIAFSKTKEDFSEDTKVKIERLATLMARYLDGADFGVEENEDPTGLLSLGCYTLLSLYDEYSKLSLLSKSPIAKAKHEELLNSPTTSKTLLKLLKKKEKDRIEHLKDIFSKLSASKNVLYNMVRVSGNQLLETIDGVIYDFYATDADYILHGLDAFPKDKKVIEFYDSFLQKSKSAYLKEQVKKYKDRVVKGVKTTGWET